MLISHKECWLDFLIAEKSRIESKVRTIESIEVVLLVAMISLVPAAWFTLKDILTPFVLVFPFLLFLTVFNQKKNKLLKVKDDYASLIWNILIGEEITLEDIRSELEGLRKDEEIAEGRKRHHSMNG